MNHDCSRPILAALYVCKGLAIRNSNQTSTKRKDDALPSLISQSPYPSLEAPDTRAIATEDPRDYLKQFPNGAVLDEIQRVPDLLSFFRYLSMKIRVLVVL